MQGRGDLVLEYESALDLEWGRSGTTKWVGWVLSKGQTARDGQGSQGQIDREHEGTQHSATDRPSAYYCAAYKPTENEMESSHVAHYLLCLISD